MSRTSRLVLVVALLACLSVAGLVLAMPRHTILARDAKPAASSMGGLKSLYGSAPAPLVAPPGSILHVAKHGDTMATLVRTYLAQSSYMTVGEFREAIRASNGNFKGDFLKAGQAYVVPGMASPISSEKSVSVPKDYEVRAVYLTGTMAGSDKGVGIVREWRKLGGNAVVFDIKDSDGSLSVAFDHPLAPKRKPAIWNLPKYTHYLHSLGMHVIARIAIFRDELLVQNHPELAVRSKSSGQAWRENGKLVWTDPSHPQVQDYNIRLALMAAQAGVDEIQFDYVRFPAEGDQKDTLFAFQKSHPDWKRSDVIASFLSRAYSEIHKTSALLSLDVFGVMAWQRTVDLAHTGQDIPQMAKYCDVLSPMIYPSHFFGMDGYQAPGDAPEHFISESMARFRKVTEGSGVVLRPWLQAFAWRTKTYSPEYIRVQVEVARKEGGVGFLFWNARNDYSKPFAAMPTMSAEKARFFRGDELNNRPGTVPAQGTPASTAASTRASLSAGTVSSGQWLGSSSTEPMLRPRRSRQAI